MDASPITPDLDEALRYAGVRADESGDMHRKMAEIAAQCMKTVTPRCTYRVSEIAWESGMPYSDCTRSMCKRRFFSSGSA